MKITYNWLKDFLPGLENYSPEDMAFKLTMSGTEVKKLEYFGEKYKNIIVAQIESFIKHPDADKLFLCKVNTGREILDIICGANNFRAGDITVLALEGAKIGNFTIKKSKIRGQFSEGMMCSEKELGLSQESEGILILKGDYIIGESFAKQAGLDDWVFEIEITPNRPDCLSVLGIAREISAVTDLKLKEPDYKTVDEINVDKKFKIEIKDYSLCPRYSAKIFNNIIKKETPFWMKNRLLLCEVRSVNLIVDLTNYVMLETGQPLHAFDSDLLTSKKIIIRPAFQKESILTIDGVVRNLSEDMLVIADEKSVVAIAGIMGGKDTEINEDTRNVFLESANFNGPSIMKTSKKIGLRSEASNRFEKKIDPGLTVMAIKRFEDLLNKITEQQFEKGIYDSYLEVNRERLINLRYKKILQVLGIKIERNTISQILEKLGIKNKAEEDYVSALVPSFRFEDLEREIDLVEEIARIYGFEKIPAQEIESKSRQGKYTYYQKMVKEIRQSLADQGLNEVINYSFTSLRELKFFKLSEEKEFKDYVKILNPLNEDFEILRTSLVQSLIGNLKYNVSKKITDLKIFEISKVFFKNGIEDSLPLEKNKLAILISGRASLKSWNRSERFFDFYDLKGVIEYLFGKFQLKDKLSISNNEYRFFHPKISGNINLNNDMIGIIGKIHPQLANAIDIKQDIYYMELDLDSFIAQAAKKRKEFYPIAQFPSINMDMAIVIDGGVPNKVIEQEILRNGGQILRSIRLFDFYKGKQIEEGKKSLAYSLEFRADDRTLKDLEVEILFKRIVENLSRKFNASLRQ